MGQVLERHVCGVGGETPKLGERAGEVQPLSEGWESIGRLKSSAEAWQLEAASPSSKRALMSVSEFGLHSC